MKILNLMFTDKWSWGLTVLGLEKALSQYEWSDQMVQGKISDTPCDVILSQQVTLMHRITEKEKTICRLGGNRTMDEGKPGAFDNEMKQVFAIIATNQRLFDIAKKINPNTYLIPNGLDIDKWSPVTGQSGVLIAGFAGNISGKAYREYKGYDLVEEACKETKVTLKTALFGDSQIPHEDMKEKFYSQIGVLVHPTQGEGCSNVIMEALACGVPVITTREAGYHGEMLRDGVNVLFCERTVESIVKCLRRLKQGPSSKKLRVTLSENGRKFAEKHHDIKAIAKEYDEIFQACYKKNQGRTEKRKTETVRMVKVRALEPIYEDGSRKVGDVFQMSFYRAKQLGKSVEVIDG